MNADQRAKAFKSALIRVNLCPKLFPTTAWARCALPTLHRLNRRQIKHRRPAQSPAEWMVRIEPRSDQRVPALFSERRQTNLRARGTRRVALLIGPLNDKWQQPASLVAHGVASSRLINHGYGDTRSLVPNTSDANGAKNRRVKLKKKDCK